MKHGRTRWRGSILVAACAVALALVPRAHAYIYWTEYGVGRANLDGSGVDESFAEYPGDAAPGDPWNVAVGPQGIYWSSRSPIRAILLADLNGSGATTFADIADGSETGKGVAVDATHVYWSDLPPDNRAFIGRANLDGTGVDPDFMAIGNNLACGLAVSGNWIYWSNYWGKTIGAAPLDGSGGNTDHLISTAGNPCGVAVDGSHVYWTQYPRDNPERPATIGRANLDGSGVDQSFIRPRRSICGVAVNASHIYWGGFSIGRAKLDGSRVDDRFIDRSTNCGIAVDSLAPPNTRISRAKVNARRGSASFRFKASGQASGFQCNLKRGHRGKFRRCRSPQAYKHLKPGSYTFAVRAVDKATAGSDPSPAKKKFRIR